MHVKILLFAALAERANRHEALVPLPEPATVHTLLAEVGRLHPELADLLPRCFVSVNQEYANAETPIGPGDEIAILPPVSGGEDGRFRITDQPLSADAVIRLVSNPRAGAVLTFVGTVREFTHGQRTVSLTYEAYVPMAIQKMKQIADEIKQRWPQAEVAMHHRIGDLAIEDIAVIIAVATPHRSESFEAGRYAIERLKQIVPIWKKEIWEDGSEWKGHQQGPWNPLSRPED